MPDLSARVFVVTAVVGLIAIAWAVMRWRAPSPAQRAADSETQEPLVAWVQAALAVISGSVDYGQLPRAEARQMLIHWWEVYGPTELADTMRSLSDPERPDNAWDLLRFVVVTRLGAAAQYVAQDDAWTQILPIARRLQATYPAWPDMAHAYVIARRQWKGIATDGSEDDDGMRRILDNIADAREVRWTQLAWNTPLDPIDAEPLDD